MADKGFDLKVLVPTDDGLTISETGIENASYYLMYNLSNRSYQLVGKMKTSSLFEHNKFSLSVLEGFCIQNNIDNIIINQSSKFELGVRNINVDINDISEALNHIIDKIEKKEELT